MDNQLFREREIVYSVRDTFVALTCRTTGISVPSQRYATHCNICNGSTTNVFRQIGTIILPNMQPARLVISMSYVVE